MPAAIYNITIEKGATFARTLYIKDAAGVAVDITGETYRGAIRDSYTAVSKIDFTCTVTNAALGEVTVVMAATTTATINFADNKGVYDIERAKVDTTVDRILQGSVKISPEATY